VTVACSIEALSPKAKNCLGKSSRDKGHKRVPEPPAMMTGKSCIGFDMNVDTEAADLLLNLTQVCEG
jgi:hypothetical protein